MSEVLNQADVSSFRDCLEGPSAFYNQKDYLETTRQDFLKTTPLPVHYTWTTESKIKNIVKNILVVGSMLVGACGAVYFKNYLAKTVSIIGGSTVAMWLSSPISLPLPLPAITPEGLGYSENHAHESRAQVPLESEWKYKRITLEVDGNKIDATIMGKASTLGQGRWVLKSNMFHEFYEDHLSSDVFKRFLTEVNSNAIVFNYPQVGATPGFPTKETTAKAYRLMLTFLEDQKRGVGAKEIVGVSHYTGGAVQGDALTNHILKKGVKYVFVHNQTFSDTDQLPPIPKRLLRIVGLGWDTAESSKKLQAPEIILQRANVENFEVIKESSQIVNAPGLPAKASLAKALLDDPHCPKHNKVFIGVPKNPNKEAGITFLAQKIEELLQKQSQKVDS